uniref:Ubiquitin-like domain-containing protein n=1 Tax=Oryza brachyantha TaxID=4533 RepID=J3L8W2_ORYBR
MAQRERVAIRVRAHDGRSIVVTLAASATVKDLRAALRSSFAPALASPDFHLFLKGAKLIAERGREPPHRLRRVHIFHPSHRQVDAAPSRWPRLETVVEVECAESLEHVLRAKTQVFLAWRRRR